MRKKRANGSGASRSKKSRTKSDAQMNLTSDAALPTDPLGPPEGATSPGGGLIDIFGPPQLDGASNAGSGKNRVRSRANEKGPGSTHSRASNDSRGSGTPGSPITFNDELGPTRRILFPSPRKDGEQRVLGEVAVNIVQTSPEFNTASAKESDGGMAGKENSGAVAQQSHGVSGSDEFADLFGTPPARPSTPPPSSAAQSGPFKTPTRPTPSHRPITRSVSKSLRSVRSVNMTSPSQALVLERTPSRTPRSGASGGIGALTSSAMRRRSPRNHQNDLPPHPHHHHLLLDEHQQLFAESPFTKSLNQLLSEANDFVAPPTPNRRGGNGNHQNHHHNNGAHGHGTGAGGFQLDLDDPGFDFGSLLSGDNIMPSSPPMLRGGHHHQHAVEGPTSSSQHHNHHDMTHFGGNLGFDDPNMNLGLWNSIASGDAGASGADLDHGDQVGDVRRS